MLTNTKRDIFEQDIEKLSNAAENLQSLECRQFKKHFCKLLELNLKTVQLTNIEIDYELGFIIHLKYISDHVT